MHMQVMGVGIPYLFDASNSKIYFSSLLIGGLTGTLYSVYATRRMDRRDESSPTEAAPDAPSVSQGWRFLRPHVSVGRRATGAQAGGERAPHAGDIRWGVMLAEYRF